MTARVSLFWGLFSITMVVYLTMLLWSLPTISSQANGLVPFDMRPGGYTFAEAQAFLSALSPVGKSFYLSTQLRLDTVYPGLLALVLAFAGMSLTPARFRFIGSIVILAAIIGAGADYLENAAIRDMLSVEVLDPAQVTKAARFTIVKSGATSVAMGVILIQLLAKLIGRLRNKKG